MTRQILIINTFALFVVSFSLAMDEKLVAIHRHIRFSLNSRTKPQSAPDPFRQHSGKPQTHTKNFIQETQQKEFQQTMSAYNPHLTFAEIERNLAARLQQARAIEVPYYENIAQLYASQSIEEYIALVKLVSACKSSAPEFEFHKLKREDKHSFTILEKRGLSVLTNELRTTINFNFSIRDGGTLYALKPLQRLRYPKNLKK